ncbi:LmbE-like protein [Neolentinus lepideus HHB14362 ss-1]|uniref:N-acetylglucosaminylphosphatidylinositol deacetylase n=1 Tax=Neolentinus lepideus HHB14362 ss-1 TaxID=1314782 RepID=A0A165SUB4_9AGAM|nr:LmbE-like protein [Neolentinus lepideus HHB14362 ss-1]
MSRFLTLLIIPVLAILFAARVEVNISQLFSGPCHARVLLLTAHPDDECMFFGPTLTALKRRQGDVDVHSLCLSIGDADGLGDVRRRELGRSLDVLGVDSRRRRVLDRQELKDNITISWDPHTIADVVLSYVSEENITTVLTFDEKGISSHPNHISLYHGTSLALTLDPSRNLKAYALVSTPVLPKYLGFSSGLVAKLRGILFMLSEQEQAQVVIAASMSEYATALRAMLQHWSQLVWFRWLYITFSRYMWINEWLEIKRE